MRPLLLSPFALAALVTLANAAKPVTVDDTAYLLYARHIAAHSADPYGFTIFWWSRPEPAMQVLCPPVVPYWFALGVRLFGESPALLKLWLFPFVYLLAWSLRALLRRFASGTEGVALPLLMLSPAVLPTVNLMLDVPAVALALAAVEVFLRACSRAVPLGPRHLLVGPPSRGGPSDEARQATEGPQSPPRCERVPLGSRHLLTAAFAGLLAALAIETKYTALVVPGVFAWAGLTHRRPLAAGVAVGACVALFAGWELFVAQKYGHSHFLFHALGSGAPPAEPSGGKFAAFAEEKGELIPPLVGYLGCLAVGAGLLAASALRVPRKWLVAVAGVWCAGFALVCLLPHRWTVIDGDLTFPLAFWQAAGWCWVAAVAACGAVLLFRVRKGLAPRLSADSWFLVGWLALEVTSTLVVTPFPAARRVIGVTLVAGLVAARAASRVRRAKPERRAPRWVLALGIAAGVVVAAIDTLDAFPEKACAERAAEVARDRPADSAVWFVGHWGFQFYCEREGMRPLVPGQTMLRAGDYLVLPSHPGEDFHRPYAGFPVVEPAAGEEVAVIEWDDWLSARTVPNFYGGANPVAGRDGPRLRVRVYRLRQDWVMGQ